MSSQSDFAEDAIVIHPSIDRRRGFVMSVGNLIVRWPSVASSYCRCHRWGYPGRPVGG